MSAIHGFRSIEINLSQQRAADLRGPSKRIILVSSVAVFFLLLGLIWGVVVDSKVNDLDQQFSDGNLRLSQLQSQLQQMNANGRLDVWKDLPQAIEQSNVSPLRVFKAFAAHLPSDATVNSWVMDGTNTVRCEIDFGSTESLIRFRTTLSKDPQFQIASMESFMNKNVGDPTKDSYLPVTSVNFLVKIIGLSGGTEGAVKSP